MSERTQGHVSVLVDLVSSVCDDAQRAWFFESMAAAASEGGRSRVLAAYSGASRRLGPARAEVDDETARSLEEHALLGVSAWDAARTARAALVATAVEQTAPGDRAAFVDELFRTGDNAERAALLGCLAALPSADAYADTAVEACRTNVVTVFEAIACDNVYPQCHFPDPAFNQMVLKAIFLGVAVRRIAGMGDRVTDELARMTEGYASERRAAGRPVPDDVGFIAELATARGRG